MIGGIPAQPSCPALGLELRGIEVLEINLLLLLVRGSDCIRASLRVQLHELSARTLHDRGALARSKERMRHLQMGPPRSGPRVRRLARPIGPR